MLDNTFDMSVCESYIYFFITVTAQFFNTFITVQFVLLPYFQSRASVENFSAIFHLRFLSCFHNIIQDC